MLCIFAKLILSLSFMSNPYPKEIAAVSNLAALKRYQHFVKKVADAETLYTLIGKADERAFSELEGKELSPVWPAAVYAELNKTGEWETHTVTPLDLDPFMDQALPNWLANGKLVNVFPMNGKTGFVVTPAELLRDLQAELANY